MSIASRTFLAVALAMGLLIPGGAQAAVQGFLIALTNMTFAPFQRRSFGGHRGVRRPAGKSAPEQ